jgi:pilus assembly protein CpaC
VWERSGGLRRYEIVVQRDLGHLNDQMRELFPGESIDAQSSGKGMVLSGSVSSKDISDKAKTVAGGYVDKAEEVVNLLRIQESTASNQVLLQVRFAEVSRSAITDLGSSLFTGAAGYKNVLARSTTTTPAPTFDTTDQANPKLVFSDFLNLFLFDTKHQLGTVIKALQTKGQFQSLAEPNLVAESGKEASFLAGGEFPVPIAQGSGTGVVVSVAYKEFGVRLSFTPVINGNRVHLKVKPEVSTLDFANGVLLQGFRIPALSTRRTETELELEDGQTFAIAGLINNSMNTTLQKIPGIGDIPILGLLFKSKAASKDQTELVVMITPHILPRNSPGVTATLPRTPETFLPAVPANKTVAPLPPAFTPGRAWSGADASAAPDARFSTPVTSVSPASAPATAASPADAATILSPPPTARTVIDGNAPAARPTAAPASSARPLTADERKAFERSQKKDGAARPMSAKDQTKQAEADRRARQAADEQELKVSHEQGKLAREQAKRDAESAKVQAKRDMENAKVQAKHDAEASKVAAEEAKRQAELERVHQKALDEAAAKAREADAKYQAELSRKQK